MRSIASTSSRTAPADFCRAALVGASSGSSTTCSMPPAPSFTGTPTNRPLMLKQKLCLGWPSRISSGREAMAGVCLREGKTRLAA